MTTFEKATLQEVEANASPNPQAIGAPISVQINPASLRLQIANNVDVGKAFARPNTQYQGSSSSTLSFDLVFDSADEGTTESPVDVRTRTRKLEQFLLPKKGAKAVPPRVRFHYGTLDVVGVMASMTQEFDLFSAGGVPLRAKCSVAIKEQKPEFDASKIGPGSNSGAAATSPIPPAGGPAGPGAPAPDRTGTAMAGESASAFAARMGLDPKAWKGIAGLAGVADPLSLSAGAQIDFSSALSAGAGLGVQASATAGIAGGGAGGTAPGALPGPSSPPGTMPPPGPPPVPADGAALTAQGGVSQVAARATAAAAGAAAAATMAAFPAAASPPPPPPAAPATAAPPVDARAASFGFGVPLRPRTGGRSAATVALVHDRFPGRVAASAGDVPTTDDPSVPRWQALPPVVGGGIGAGGAIGRRAIGGCGCGQGHVRAGCGCGGGR